MSAGGNTGTDTGEAGDTAVGRRIRELLRDVPDFPSPGILFRDIAPLLADAAAFAAVIDGLAETVEAEHVDLVAGIEARGFLMAGALATRLRAGVLPVRKAGKLPPPTVRASYDLEYGSAEIEVPVGVPAGHRVLLVDDVLATGGTMRAATELLRDAGAQVIATAVVVELDGLGGRAVLDPDTPLTALLTV